MINPDNITQFNCRKPRLEEYILFWVCTAGKTAHTSARCLDKFLKHCRQGQRLSPFNAVRQLYKRSGTRGVARLLKKCGMGCHTQKARTFVQLIKSDIDLKTCTVDDLEQIKGIGQKTSRCFILHSRPNQRLAGLDTHILKYMSDLGYDVPKSTPKGNRYKELEQEFLALVDNSGKTASEFDFEIWKSGNDKFNS